MLGRVMRNVALLSALALAVPTLAQAQASIYVGPGVLLPVGDFGDVADAGWMAVGGFFVPVGSGNIAVGAEGFYGSASGVDDGPSTDVYGALGTIGLAFGEAGSVRPFVFGGAGIIGADVDLGETEVDASDTSFGYEAGAGLSIPAGERFGIFIEGRYMGSSDLDMLGVVAGVGIGLGG